MTDGKEVLICYELTLSANISSPLREKPHNQMSVRGMMYRILAMRCSLRYYYLMRTMIFILLPHAKTNNFAGGNGGTYSDVFPILLPVIQLQSIELLTVRRPI